MTPPDIDEIEGLELDGAEPKSADPPRVSGSDEAKFFEQYRYKYLLAKQRQGLGFVGKFLGSDGAAGTNIAGLVIAFCLITYAVTLFVDGDHLAVARAGLLGLAGSALGYVFGVSARREPD
ncbi:hypothetical protein IMZ29_07155 [Achromobacter sp. GG226]|uniref:hypothetical protein n=1 Tax=Verticiella alkaliphila TaxID=2779529 RepID=UPI001C0CBB70|nr:hypothetical protein [Verticiella sp. GG226]MBU4610325.1 hypothetical protein [Verticiella sp. GG226]